MAELPENEYLIDLYDEEESEVSEIVIFRTVEDKDGESALEQVLESEVLSAVYDVFRDRNADKFDFQM